MSEGLGFEQAPKRKLGSAQCPDCGKFARVFRGGHYAYPDGEWTYTVDCKGCGGLVIA